MKLKRIVASLLAATALPASAATIFTSVPDFTVNPGVNGWCSSCGGRYRVFDAFTLATTQTISSVTFAVSSYYYFPTPIDVSFWTDVAGLPGTEISSAVYAPSAFTSTVNTPYNTSLVSVDYTQKLAAGTYLISFYNSSNLAIPGYSGGGNHLYQQGGGLRGDSAGFSLAGGAVPEPASWALMVVGFGLVGAATRRRPAVLAA